MRYIDADNLMDIAWEHMDDFALAGLQNALDEVPTADVVEVVRCRDCKFKIQTFCVCNKFDRITGNDDYCSYGERREDECY